MLYIIKYDEQREGRPFGSDITTGFCSKFSKVKCFLGVGIFFVKLHYFEFFFFFFSVTVFWVWFIWLYINGCVLNYIYEEL